MQKKLNKIAKDTNSFLKKFIKNQKKSKLNVRNYKNYRDEWEDDMMSSLGYIPDDGPSKNPDDYL